MIFPKEERKFVTFKTEFLGGPVIKVTKKVKLQSYPMNLKDIIMTIEFCAVDKNESVSATFWE